MGDEVVVGRIPDVDVAVLAGSSSALGWAVRRAVSADVDGGAAPGKPDDPAARFANFI